MRRSFSFRLAAAFAGVGIAAAALTAILVNTAFGGRFAGYLDQQRLSRERQIVAAIADSYKRMAGWNRTDLDTLAPLALMDGGTLRLQDSSGRTVWEALEGSLGAHLAAMHAQMMNSGPLGTERRLPVTVDGTVVGTAFMQLPTPGVLPADVAFRASINRLLLAGGIGAGIAALLLGLFLARRATAPARELTRAARALASGDRSQRVESRAEDEFGEMAQTFNLMADTIQEEDRLRRAFAADVAHELRTPLAILRSEVEAMQDGVTKATPAALASLHEETLRLTRLVGDLETLARADAAGFSLERSSLDVRTVAKDAADEFAPHFETRGIALERSLASCVIDADATRLRQVIANLLSNALKFTPDRGRVRVETVPEAGWAVVRVSDTGPGIPADEIDYVFDRFYRGAGARASGSGIGLTVVRELVRAHGGEVSIESQTGSGTTITVRLPQTSSAARDLYTPSSWPGVIVGPDEGRTP